MGNVVVAVLGPPGYGSGLGKKVTSTDITLYDAKKDEDTVTFVEPTRYPERLAPLFYAASMAKKAVVVVDELNSLFGECILMLDCSGIEKGYIVLRNYLEREKIEPLIRGTVLEKYDFVEDDQVKLREHLLYEASQQRIVPPSDDHLSGTVPVDHSFNVKGVGPVVLGVVMSGAVRKHEEVRALPGEKKAQIRSIQKHDDDFDWATEGDRVGLALKNIEVNEVDRGTVLTADEAIRSTTALKAHASLVRYWPAPIKVSMVLHVGHWMQFIAGKVEAVDSQEDWRHPVLSLDFEKELVYLPGHRAVVTYLDGGKLRIAGSLELS